MLLPTYYYQHVHALPHFPHKDKKERNESAYNAGYHPPHHLNSSRHIPVYAHICRLLLKADILCSTGNFLGHPGLSLWLSNSCKTSRYMYVPWSTYMYFWSYENVYIVSL